MVFEQDVRPDRKRRNEGRRKAKSKAAFHFPKLTRRQHLRMPTTLCLMSQAKLVGTQKQLHEHPVHPVEARQHNNNHFCLPVCPQSLRLHHIIPLRRAQTIHYVVQYIQTQSPRVACPAECVKSNGRSGGYLKFVQLSTSQNKELCVENGERRMEREREAVGVYVS